VRAADGCGGGEPVADDNGVLRIAVGDDLGGDEFMDDALLSPPPPPMAPDAIANPPTPAPLPAAAAATPA
jgi:hypothetical protein